MVVCLVTAAVMAVVAEPSGNADATTLELDHYAWQSRLQVTDNDGLCAILLEIQELARARPDLADVRITDASGRQVPYALERHAVERWQTLDIVALPARAGTGVSRWRLRAQELQSKNRGLIEASRNLSAPLSALSLEVAEPSFSRPVFVTAPLKTGEGRLVLFAGRLLRSEGQHGPIMLSLKSVRAPELLVEIEDAGSPPLTLTSARGRLLVPRLVFACPGAELRLRLVYGASRASEPSYDTEALRSGAATSALHIVRVGPPEPNPSFLGAAADDGALARARVVLWIALVVLVAGLGLVVLRLTRKLTVRRRR
jgi:hypothetical protein